MIYFFILLCSACFTHAHRRFASQLNTAELPTRSSPHFAAAGDSSEKTIGTQKLKINLDTRLKQDIIENVGEVSTLQRDNDKSSAESKKKFKANPSLAYKEKVLKLRTSDKEKNIMKLSTAKDQSGEVYEKGSIFKDSAIHGSTAGEKFEVLGDEFETEPDLTHSVKQKQKHVTNTSPLMLKWNNNEQNPAGEIEARQIGTGEGKTNKESKNVKNDSKHLPHMEEIYPGLVEISPFKAHDYKPVDKIINITDSVTQEKEPLLTNSKLSIGEKQIDDTATGEPKLETAETKPQLNLEYTTPKILEERTTLVEERALSKEVDKSYSGDAMLRKQESDEDAEDLTYDITGEHLQHSWI